MVNGSDVTVIAIETTQNVPNQDTVSLTMQRAVSIPFVVATTDSVSYLLDYLTWPMTQM